MSKDARICVIGAGPSGIAGAKELLQAGFQNIRLFDRGKVVGGNWVFDAESGHSSVFETTHIISSKMFSEYDDFPMPADYPDYPSHRQLAAYFQNYAHHFGVDTCVEFETKVVRCVPNAGWDVTIENAKGEERTEHFDVLVVANGHHWKPRWPSYPGTLTARYVHSHDFKNADSFRGERVLVIGGGNSACDVAVETSRVSARTDLSWRRGYWIIPKFIFGKPVDLIHHAFTQKFGKIPLRLRMRGLERLLKIVSGPNSRYGLPEPDHGLGETHPTLNSELLYFLRHGKIRVKPDIARWDEKNVHFKDGSVEEYDSVVACTGFEIAHPFFEKSLIDFSQGVVPLYLKMIPEKFDNLFFLGLFQPLGCIWPCAQLQARIMARQIAGTWHGPSDLNAAIGEELANPDIQQIDSPRHTITVDEPMFRRRLTRALETGASR